MYSKHYLEDRKFREEAIQKFFGEDGKVVFDIVKWDSVRKKYMKYEITENAVLIVKVANRENFIVTKMLARPSRIKRYWDNPTEEVMKKAIENSRDPRRSA